VKKSEQDAILNNNPNFSRVETQEQARITALEKQVADLTARLQALEDRWALNATPPIDE
jgi:uncharacterized protein YceH (UPF0502 family)